MSTYLTLLLVIETSNTINQIQLKLDIKTSLKILNLYGILRVREVSIKPNKLFRRLFNGLLSTLHYLY